MKQLLTLLFALLLGSQLTFAQDSKKLETFKQKVLPEYNLYFNQAELTEYGQLDLSAADKYIMLPADGKKAIMVHICTAWRDSLVIVHYGYKRELWGWRVKTGNTQLLDEWDLNAPKLSISPKAALQKTALHPWFFYIGGQFGGDNQSNTNLAFNTRLGFFLLKNRWDLATSLSAGKISNPNSKSTGWSNFGLLTRVYFPIKKYKISPNIGAGVTFGDNDTSPYLNLGICWFVGFGSLDIGIQIGSEVASMGGYTVAPKSKNTKGATTR